MTTWSVQQQEMTRHQTYGDLGGVTAQTHEDDLIKSRLPSCSTCWRSTVVRHDLKLESIEIEVGVVKGVVQDTSVD